MREKTQVREYTYIRWIFHGDLARLLASLGYEPRTRDFHISCKRGATCISSDNSILSLLAAGSCFTFVLRARAFQYRSISREGIISVGKKL